MNGGRSNLKIKYILMILTFFHSVPPLPTITVGDEHVTVVRGSSCWFTNGSGQCVDMVSPKELLENVEPTVVESDSILHLVWN